MDTILDYVLWERDLPFSVRDVSEADSVVFSFLSYMDLGDIRVSGRRLTVAECCRRLLEKPEGMTEAHRKLYAALADSSRFGPVVIQSYMESLVEEDSVQFSAMLFELRPDQIYIAFRGTDNTLAGWKEDFMGSFTQTGSQQMALRYLRRHLQEGIACDVGGHSKGGNLAMYALSRIEDEKLRWVRHVYLHDSPGLCPDVMDVGPLDRIRSRTVCMLPAFSVIGRLFDPGFPDTRIIRSSAEGILQHDIETWGIDHGNMMEADGPDPAAGMINEKVAGWLREVNQTERQHLVDDLFRIAESGGARTVEELHKEKIGSAVSEFAASAAPESRSAAAKLTRAALFGTYTDKIWNLRLIRWLRTSAIAGDLMLILGGFLFQLLPAHIMGVTVGLVLALLVGFEVLVTLRHLMDSGWDLKSERVRVNATIMLVGMAYLLLVKEQALFNLSTILFGMLFLVMAYNHAAFLGRHPRWTVPWLRHLTLSVMYAVIGFFVMISPEHAISWYADRAGHLLVFDGMCGIIHRIQQQWTQRKAKKNR